MEGGIEEEEELCVVLLTVGEGGCNTKHISEDDGCTVENARDSDWTPKADTADDDEREA